MDGFSVLSITILFPLFFAAIWLSVTGLLAVMSGWRQLATQYVSRQPSQGKDFYMVSGTVGSAAFPVSYNNCLTVFIASNGFYIQPIALLAFFSPKLFIPWRDVEVIKTSYLFFPVWRIRVKNSWVAFAFYSSFGSVMLEAWTASRSSLETRAVS